MALHWSDFGVHSITRCANLCYVHLPKAGGGILVTTRPWSSAERDPSSEILWLRVTHIPGYGLSGRNMLRNRYFSDMPDRRNLLHWTAPPRFDEIQTREVWTIRAGLLAQPMDERC